VNPASAQQPCGRHSEGQSQPAWPSLSPVAWDYPRKGPASILLASVLPGSFKELTPAYQSFLFLQWILIHRLLTASRFSPLFDPRISANKIKGPTNSMVNDAESDSSPGPPL